MKDRDWFSLDTAPKDGTLIELTNDSLQRIQPGSFFVGHYGEYTFGNNGKTHSAWLLDVDPEPLIPLRIGTLIFPDKWRPYMPFDDTDRLNWLQGKLGCDLREQIDRCIVQERQ